MKRKLLLTAIQFVFILTAGVSCDREPGSKVTEVKLNEKALELTVGATKTLKASVKPDNMTGADVKWSSDKPSVAMVDPATGMVTAVAEGEATITVEAEDGGCAKDVCKVTVVGKVIPVNKVELNLQTATVQISGQLALTAVVRPEGATNTELLWMSSASDIATVDPATGMVTAVAEGEATITVKTIDGGLEAECVVTVVRKSVPVDGVMLEQDMEPLEVGMERTLKAVLLPEGATNQTVIWNSSAPAVATIDNLGKVKAISVGDAVLTVTTADGGYEANCRVTVIHVRVNEIYLDSKAFMLNAGQSRTLAVSAILPGDAADKSVGWNSSAPNVATVDASTGKVTAVAAGETTITATANDGGGAKGECNVRVVNESAMILTINKEGEANIGLAGSGTATIDWGDGSAFETITLSRSMEMHTHNYSTASVRNVIIDGRDITGLDCSSNNGLDCRSNLTAILVGNNSALEELDCRWNYNLTTLDVSNSIALTRLDCRYCDLKTLDVSGCPALKELDCGLNDLTILDVSNNTALTSLGCGGNLLTHLDVGNNTALTMLECGRNELTTLDVSNNTVLERLSCITNELTTLDVHRNVALRELYCLANKLTTLDVSGCTALTKLWCYDNKLTTLDVSHNVALTGLRCYLNQLTTFDISNNTALKELYCENNRLTTLDVSKNTAVEWLECWGNELTALDVSNNTALTFLKCGHNRLTVLDVSNNTALTVLDCESNQLTALDVSKNTTLNWLGCQKNKFTAAGFNALFNTLHGNWAGGSKTIFIKDNPGTAECDKTIAITKGWEINTVNW